ncbi:MAG: lytic murein transglycosylase B [Gammaproteobacteria bacterium]
MSMWKTVSIMLLVGCTVQPERSELETASEKVEAASVQPELVQPLTSVSAPLQLGPYYAQSISGDYAAYPELDRFVDHMVAQHGFTREFLKGLFSQAKRKQWTLDYLRRSDEAVKTGPSRGSWSRYLAKFMDKRHINSGTEFWLKYEAALQKAHEQYGVPPEYILGILAVETKFGGYVGSHRVLDALTTLAFDYPRRADYFRVELENFLLMAGKEGFDPAKPIGSFAGAMGLGQFMPSSFLRWAVDFNGDGERNLWNPEDAIGSIANYFSQHGWQPGRPVVTPADATAANIDHLKTGVIASYSLDSLMSAGIQPGQACDCDYDLHLLRLSNYKNDEYWLGHPNFYVITRYNQSSYYAMAVHSMAQAIKKDYRKTQLSQFSAAGLK